MLSNPRSHEHYFNLLVCLGISSSALAVLQNSEDECWRNYPYTYSKCQALCSSHLEDATCLDDQLCLCVVPSYTNGQFAQLRLEDETNEASSVPYLNTYFGAKQDASCYFSDFCEDLCRNDESLSNIAVYEQASVKIDGALCTLDDLGISVQEIQSCVCSIDVQIERLKSV